MGVMYTLSDTAYVKLVLHALKHPLRGVCGALVGRAVGDDAVEVTDALPMLHSTLAVTPSAEIALEQCAAHADLAGGLRLVGVYVANELEKDVSLGRFASKLADAARSASPGGKGCALVLDPAKLARAVADGGGPPAVILMTRGAERWERVADQSAALTCAGGGCAKLARCYRDGMADRVIDFDDHLDDPADDWRNGHLDDAIAKAV